MDQALVDHAAEIAQKKAENLNEEVQRFTSGISKVKKQFSKLKIIRKQAIESTNFNKMRLSHLKEDVAISKEKLDTISQKLNEFDSFAKSKIHAMKNDIHNSDDVKENIMVQKLEVTNNIKSINNATLEYEFNNRLTRTILSLSRENAYDVYKKWMSFYPMLQLYMTNDHKINSNVYMSATVEGMMTELLSHQESKEIIEEFQGNFSAHSDAELKTNSSTVRATQQERAHLFDCVHSDMMERLGRVVNHCETLSEEVAIREELRSELNQYIMEVCNALQADLVSSTDTAEREAMKPVGTNMSEIKKFEENERRKELAGEANKVTVMNQNNYNSINIDSGNYSEVFGNLLTAVPPETPNTTTRKNTENNAKSIILPNNINGNISGVNENSSPANVPVIGSALDEEPSAILPYTAPTSAPPVVESIQDQMDNIIHTRYNWYISKYNNSKKTQLYKHCYQSVVNGNDQYMKYNKQGTKVAPVVNTIYANTTNMYKNMLQLYPNISLPVTTVDHDIDNNINISSTINTTGQKKINSAAPLHPNTTTAANVTTDHNNHTESRQNSANVAVRSGNGNNGGGRNTAADRANDAEDDDYSSLFSALSEDITHYNEVIDAALLPNNKKPLTPAGQQWELEYGSVKSVVRRQKDDIFGQKQQSPRSKQGVGSGTGTMYATAQEIVADCGPKYRQLLAHLQYSSGSLSLDTISKVSEVLETVKLSEELNAAATPSLRLQKHATQQKEVETIVKDNEEKCLAAKNLLISSRDAVERWLASSVTENYKASLAAFDALLPSLSLYPKPEVVDAQPIVGGNAQGNPEVKNKPHKKLSRADMAQFMGFDESELEFEMLDRITEENHTNVPFSSIATKITRKAQQTGNESGGYSVMAQQDVESGDSYTVSKVLDISTNLLSKLNNNIQQYDHKPVTHRATIHSGGDGGYSVIRPGSGGINMGFSRPGTGNDGIAANDRYGSTYGNSYNNSRPNSNNGAENGVTLPKINRRSTDIAQHYQQANDAPMLSRLNSNNYNNFNNSNNNANSATSSATANSITSPRSNEKAVFRPPTNDTVLGAMESIIHGEMYSLTFTWMPEPYIVLLTAKCFLTLTQYKEYSLCITPRIISDLVLCSEQSAFRVLFQDPPKLFQLFISTLRIEVIDGIYYDIIVRNVIGNTSAGNNNSSNNNFNRQYRFDINKMICRPISAPNVQQSTTAGAAGTATEREHEYILTILSMRKKDNALLTYSFVSQHTIERKESISGTGMSPSRKTN